MSKAPRVYTIDTVDADGNPRGRGLKPVSFRLSAAERGKGEARAARAGCSIHELARRAFVAFLIGDGPVSTPVSTPGDGPRVVYDE